MTRFTCTTVPMPALILLCPPATVADCPGDLDADGVTDLTDLAILLEAHGTAVGDPGYNPSADLDANGTVDLSDLARILDDQGCRTTEPASHAMPTEDLPFEELEIGNKRVLFHQRIIGPATVEKDFIVYHYDLDTGEFLAKKKTWRDDLPDRLPEIIPQEAAEALVEGDIQFNRLYYIAPDSFAFPLDPPPHNPAWVVNSDIDGLRIIKIIDAVTGELLGDGLSPPYTGFSFTGPAYVNPCQYGWADLYINAKNWFDDMGYETDGLHWPTKDRIRSHIESTTTAMFYEVAHGNTERFINGCDETGAAEYTYASEIAAWIEAYPKMPFTFIASCDGMCGNSEGTFSHAFRKGSEEDTVTVGYCGMSMDFCDSCWSNAFDWQNDLFSYMDQGWAVKDAYDQVMAEYPMCYYAPYDFDCMQFAGDEDFAMVPVVSRDPAQIEYQSQDAGQMQPADEGPP